MEIFSESTERGYRAISNITQTQLTATPWFLAEHNLKISELMSQNVCENFLESYERKTVSCNDELMKKGLETISIFVFENSRKVLNQFDTSEKTTESSVSLLNSEDVKNLGECILIGANRVEIYTQNTGFAYNSSISTVHSRTVELNAEYAGLSTLFMIIVNLTGCFAITLFWFSIVSKVERSLWKVKGMLGMIPIQIVMQDGVMKKIFLSFGQKGTSELEKSIRIPRS